MEDNAQDQSPEVEVKEKKKPGPKPKVKEEKEEGQPELFKLYTLKVDAVEIPYIDKENNKVEWRRVGPAQWNEDSQNTLFAYWRKRKEEDDKFDIEAKKQKLFKFEKNGSKVEYI